MGSVLSGFLSYKTKEKRNHDKSVPEIEKNDNELNIKRECQTRYSCSDSTDGHELDETSYILSNPTDALDTAQDFQESVSNFTTDNQL